MLRYGGRMTDASNPAVAPEAVEAVLRAELAHGDAMIGTIVPILRHLVASDDHSVFSEEIVARTRAMFEDLARQLLVLRSEALGEGNPRDLDPDRLAELVHILTADNALLAHVHALALEWQLTERLHGRIALDPVLSPLLQALIASSDAVTAGLAMNLLASQARYVQAQRRMQLVLAELPVDLVHGAALALRTQAGAEDAAAAEAEARIRQTFDESRSRLGLLSRLVMGMGGGAMAALSVEHAGVAMFLTALSIATGQDRSLAVLATNESQLARLALGLSAAGLKPQTVEEQFLALHPEVALPIGFEQLGPDRAAAILAHGAGYPA